MSWKDEWDRRTELDGEGPFGETPASEDSLYGDEVYPESQWELDHTKVKAFIAETIEKERKEAVREYDAEVEYQPENQTIDEILNPGLALLRRAVNRDKALKKRGICHATIAHGGEPLEDTAIKQWNRRTYIEVDEISPIVVPEEKLRELNTPEGLKKFKDQWLGGTFDGKTTGVKE